MTVEIYGKNHQLLYIFCTTFIELSMQTKTLYLKNVEGDLEEIKFKSYLHYPKQNRLILNC